MDTSKRAVPRWAPLAAALVCLAAAAGPQVPSAFRVAEGEVEKTIPPGRSELPGSAFKKLDGGNKGYLVVDDVKALQGFDMIFATADANHDGKLSPEEFKKAWKAYTASGNSNRG